MSSPINEVGYSRKAEPYSEKWRQKLHIRGEPQKGQRENKASKIKFCNKRKKGKSVKRSPRRYLSAKKKALKREVQKKKEKHKRMQPYLIRKESIRRIEKIKY